MSSLFKKTHWWVVLQSGKSLICLFPVCAFSLTSLQVPENIQSILDLAQLSHRANLHQDILCWSLVVSLRASPPLRLPSLTQGHLSTISWDLRKRHRGCSFPLGSGVPWVPGLLEWEQRMWMRSGGLKDLPVWPLLEQLRLTSLIFPKAQKSCPVELRCYGADPAGPRLFGQACSQLHREWLPSPL